ncbi:CapA family protein [Clostridium sp. SHJSY1]|uniref:CapA family protein n=1 Tax=Clostridium sp. SHJSY1 TaxID=2942483 RepID=UPI002875DC7D|nr:CapA family protein [Clostridium sp. SHJSY1]MDS0526267.1 CapA family protein [Clostridium sp. SHJSY1]
MGRFKKSRIFNKVTLITVLVVAGCILIFTEIIKKDSVEIKTVENEEKAEAVNTTLENKPDINSTIKITSVGNILFHGKQLVGAKTKDGYDFKPSFNYMKDVVSGADIAIGTLETTFGGGEYSGYPTFNSPDEVLPSLKDMGINVINYANNHILDEGSDGFLRTLSVTKNNNIDMVGVKNNTNDKGYLVKEVDGQKIGIISYTYETEKENGQRTINSIPIPNKVNGLINTFNYDELDTFYSNIASNIDDMKKSGVNFIITNLHWGDEYSTKENNTQKNMAQKLSEMGVDIILGSHPHVIEPYGVITNSKGKKTFVVYSQGNFISNQCADEGVTHDENIDSDTEDGTVIKFTLDVKDGEVKLKEYNVIPTWVYREPKGDGVLVHKVIPVNDALRDKEKFNIPDSVYTRVQRALNNTEKILEPNEIGVHKVS